MAQTLRALLNRIEGVRVARSANGFLTTFFDARDGSTKMTAFSPMSLALMAGGLLFAKTYFLRVDPGSAATQTIAALADELFLSLRFDRLRCDTHGAVHPSGEGIPMVQSADGRSCTAVQFPQPDGLYN